MSYKPQKRSQSDMLKWCQDHVDKSATDVNVSTGEVTTNSTWNKNQKWDWINFFESAYSREIVLV